MTPDQSSVAVKPDMATVFLAELMGRGPWSYVGPNHDIGAQLYQFVWWDETTDTTTSDLIVVKGQDFAYAERSDHEGHMVWRCTPGRLGDVLAALRALPEPGTEGPVERPALGP